MSDALAKFWARVDRSDADGCWPWTGARDPRGYGRISSYTYKVSLAHRLALQLSIGEPLGDRFVIHSCDNPPCCNPAHLRVGTHQDNMRDMLSKGRNCKGVASHCAKLTESDVRVARKLYTTGLFTHRSLGELFGITGEVMHLAVIGKTWKHVPGALPAGSTRHRWGLLNDSLKETP